MVTAESGCDRLRRRIGHECGGPAGENVAPGWSAWGDEVLAAAGLLENWLPRSAGPDGSAWRLAATGWQDGEAGRSIPDLTVADAARGGCYPRVFAGAGTEGDRYPAAVEPFLPELEEDERKGAERRNADRVTRALIAFLDPRGEGLPTRARLLVAHVVGLLVHGCHDVSRVEVAAVPDGERIEGELHLLFRHRAGRTARLAVAPALPDTGQGLGRPDPACVLAGHDGCAPLTGEDHRRAAFRTRTACTTALLSESLYLNNNDRMTFGVVVEPHRLDLTADPATVDREVLGWLEASGILEDAREMGVCPEGMGEDGEGMPGRLDADGLKDLLAAVHDELVEGSIATSNWVDADDGHEVSTDPEAHLVTWLMRDFFAAMTDRAFGPADDGPRLAYAAGLPFGYFSDEYGSDGDDYGFLVLVGRECAAAVTIDACV